MGILSGIKAKLGRHKALQETAAQTARDHEAVIDALHESKGSCEHEYLLDCLDALRKAHPDNFAAFRDGMAKALKKIPWETIRGEYGLTEVERHVRLPVVTTVEALARIVQNELGTSWCSAYPWTKVPQMVALRNQVYDAAGPTLRAAAREVLFDPDLAPLILGHAVVINDEFRCDHFLMTRIGAVEPDVRARLAEALGDSLARRLAASQTDEVRPALGR